jgi:4-hydroxybutyryl-CoA dehydratase / vinylacetyl-CoA-Delta-isomerase
LGLRTADQYRASLRDGRRVYFRGEAVPDVTAHPVIRKAIDHAAIDYEMAHDPAWKELALVDGPDGPYSRYFHIPASADDLLQRSRLIAESTRLGRTVVCLIKEIGTDSLFALLHISRLVDQQLGSNYHGRVRDFYEHCRQNDLAMAVAQTDVKGDRRRGPSEQVHPDYYLRITERRSDGIVVRGAKAHTSVSVNANELIVLPTRAMKEQDKDWAVAFAIPIDTPGLKLVASPYDSEPANEFERPLSADHKMIETTTIFEDVFVPWERVFMAGEWKAAGPLAHAFVRFHRFTAISYKLPLVDLLAGGAMLMARYNGVESAGHVREKLARLATYAGSIRALTRASAREGQMIEPGIYAPDELTTNIAKLIFASGFHEALRDAQDICGGLLVTGPGQEDLQHPEIGPLLRRYFGGAAGSAESRLRAMNMMSDLTASNLGGYHAVLAVHAEGSIEAEKLMILRNFPFDAAVQLARESAGITED